MTQTLRLRRWQKRALEAFDARPGADFLAVATPGAGKTTFALAAARRALSSGQARRVIVVTPTSHLKHQWADAAAALGLHLESEWSSRGRLPADMHGAIVTYQQLSSSASALRALAEGSFAIFDEIHHAGDERAWGDAVRVAFEPAACPRGRGGTPFRSDTAAIPFIRYVDDEARADFEYGYGDALIDGRVVRPVYFPRVDGLMEWTAADGTLYSHTPSPTRSPRPRWVSG
jgi:superfamily II DNA or RNA helicase